MSWRGSCSTSPTILHAFQPGYCAAHKHQRDWQGIRALLGHVAIYTVVTTVPVTVLVWGVFGLPMSLSGLVLGQLVNALTHAWADMRWTLAGLLTLTRRWTHLPGLLGRAARAFDNTGFLTVGRPRGFRVVAVGAQGEPLRDEHGDPAVIEVDAPQLATAANRLDQDFHYVCMLGAAVLMAVVPDLGVVSTGALVSLGLAALAGLVLVATAPVRAAQRREVELVGVS